MDQPLENFKPRIDYPLNATLEQRFHLEWDAQLQKKKCTTLILTFPQAWSILSAVQLARRHSQFTGPTGIIAEAIARVIESTITPLPALKEVAKRGWNPKFDEKAG